MMKIFIRKVFIFFSLLNLMIALSFYLIAINSNKYPKLEQYTFGLTNNFGKTYQRTKDFQNWESQKTIKRGIILGSSTAYRNINTNILDSFTNVQWFNLGSTSQTLSISFELLKYANRNKNINIVFLDIYIPLLTNNGQECALDLIKNSTFPLKTKINIVQKANKNSSIFKQLIYREIKKTNHHNHVLDNYSNDTYLNKGFVINNNPSKFCTNKEIQVLKVDYNNFKPIINYCEQHKIKLFINFAPIINTRYNQNSSLNTSIIYNQDFITSKTKQNSFYDSHHMTVIGSYLYTHHIIDKIKWKLNK